MPDTFFLGKWKCDGRRSPARCRRRSMGSRRRRRESWRSTTSGSRPWGRQAGPGRRADLQEV